MRSLRSTAPRAGVLVLFLLALPAAVARDFEKDAVALRAVAARLAPSVVQVKIASRADSSFGTELDRESESTGLVVRDDGLIMVPGNVVDTDGVFAARVLSAEVIVAGGRRFPARWLGKDPDVEVGFLRVDDAAFPGKAVAFASEDRLEVGDFLASVRLTGPSFQRTPYIEAFMVSGALDEPSRCYLTSFAVSDYLGGAVSTLDGRVVGIVGWMKLQAGGTARDPVTGVESRSIFASVAGEDPGGHEIVIVPASRLRAALDHPPEDAPAPSARAPFLGVETQALLPELRDALGLPASTRGVLLTRVYPGSPAAAAGLQVEDLVTAVDGAALDVESDSDLVSFKRALLAHASGDALDLTVRRATGDETLVARLADAPLGPAEAGQARSEPFGTAARDLIYMDKVDLGLPLDQCGARVTAVSPAGFLGLAGLRVGDVVSRIDDDPVADAAAFAARLDGAAEQRAGELRLFVLRGRSSLFVHVKPDWNGTLSKNDR